MKPSYSVNYHRHHVITIVLFSSTLSPKVAFPGMFPRFCDELTEWVVLNKVALV